MPSSPAPRPALTLPPAPDMARFVRAHLIGFDAVDWLNETGSTNTDLMDWLRARDQHGAATTQGARLLGAHWQRAGRGRAGRKLLNQAGDTLMFSCAFSLRIAAARLACLPLAAGVLACDVLRRHAHPDLAAQLRLKWPNDIQLGEAKLAGLLVESRRQRAAGDAVYGIVIGMGMNLRASQRLSAQLQRPIADWSEAADHTPLANLVAAIAQAWQTALPLCARAGFSAFQSRWRAVDALYGCSIHVLDAGQVRESGVARGVDAHGRLLVEDGTRTVAVSVGDVSVRTPAAMQAQAQTPTQPPTHTEPTHATTTMAAT